MRVRKKWTAGVLAVVLAVVCAGCALPDAGFGDYDVSGYIEALLDSSYHNAHDRFIAVTGTSEEISQQNHTSTVENAPVNFCNAYGLSPNEEQLARLKDIMSRAFDQAKYTVKEEQKIETGYYIEVEVTPIGSFAGLTETFSGLRTQAMDEASAANAAQSSQGVLGEGQDGFVPGEENQDGEDWDNEDWDGEEAEPTPTPAPTPASTPGVKVDPYQLYMEKVLEYCQGQLSSIRYQEQNVTIALDIRQTPTGELQIDLNQVDALDKTMLMFGETAAG